MTQFGTPEPVPHVRFKGKINKSKNISGVGVVGDLLVIGTDEGNGVQVLRRLDAFTYERVEDITLDSSVKEIDVEGIACEGDTVYVVGSHSAKREKVEAGNTVEQNRTLLATVSPEKGRDRLFRFTLDPSGKAQDIRQTSLRKFLDKHPMLGAFAALPSKENGVDLEGIAARDGRLFIGFRGPVLRENHVPVLTCTFDDPAGTADLLFVNFGGRGFRDLAATSDGFLVMAGPVGDGPGSYQLYFWDGADCLPGIRSSGQAGRLELLGDIPTPAGAKAEGITVLNESPDGCDVLVVYDGLKDGGATLFRVPKQ